MPVPAPALFPSVTVNPTKQLAFELYFGVFKSDGGGIKIILVILHHT